VRVLTGLVHRLDRAVDANQLGASSGGDLEPVAGRPDPAAPDFHDRRSQ
jgi:hypothetical protein